MTKLEKPTRDPERTRARILAAALSEFASEGFAGARVDAIAASAGVNKRMLYHYYGNKDELYAAVLQDRLDRRGATMAKAPDDAMTTIEMFQREVRGDPDWVRFLMWEALEQTKRPLVGEQARQAKCVDAVTMMRRLQANGFFPEADPAHLALSMMAMVLWPYAFPQFARMMTGLEPDSDEFVDARIGFFRSLMSTKATKQSGGEEPAESGVKRAGNEMKGRGRTVRARSSRTRRPT